MRSKVLLIFSVLILADCWAYGQVIPEIPSYPSVPVVPSAPAPPAVPTVPSVPRHKHRYRRVNRFPARYEYAAVKASSGKQKLSKPWIVYSDRNDNITYSDKKARNPLGKVSFLEKFFVIHEKDSAVELIKYASDLLKQGSVNRIKTPSKVQYIGWVKKDKLILSENCFVDKTDQWPVKWVSMLNGTSIFSKIRNYTEGNKIKLYDAPDLKNALKMEIGFDEIVYVFKKNGNKLLISKGVHESPQNPSENILGWVSENLIQQWGERLFLNPICNNDSVKKTPFIFLSKESAVESVSGRSPENIPSEGSAVKPLSVDDVCNVIQSKWKRCPLLKIEEVKNNKFAFNLIQTGVVTPVLDKNSSFITNSAGIKITYLKLLEFENSFKNVNVVFEINLNNEEKECINSVRVQLQTLDDIIRAKQKEKRDFHIRYAVVDGLPSTVNGAKSEFYDSYSEALPLLINSIQNSVDRGGGMLPSSVENGLNKASQLFKGHEDENNIVIVISTKADSKINKKNKVLQDPVYDLLGQEDVKPLFFQPYCGVAPAYSDFVQQAKSMIERTADKVTLYRNDKLIEKSNYSGIYKYKTLMNGDSNVYCLDFPTNENTQGFLIFPTIGNKISGKCLYNALDSLLSQIDKSNGMVLDSIRSAFNSPRALNVSINKNFAGYYKKIDTLPPDISGMLGNYGYNYFMNGYKTSSRTIYKSKFFKCCLLLSKNEYDEICTVFKKLKFDQIAQQQYDSKSCSETYNAFLKILGDYNKKYSPGIPVENLTMGQFFYKICGFYSENELLNKYKVNDFSYSFIFKNDDLKNIVDYMNRRIGLFYSVRDKKGSSFNSIGDKYYWVYEDSLF